MVAERASIAQVREWLKEVADPEVPVLSVVDLGIVRDAEWRGDELAVTVTPTYCGCPAMEVIEADIRGMLAQRGVDHVSIRTQLSPPWTTDWMSDDAKSRLREYGVAPPTKRLIDVDRIQALRTAKAEIVACPHCGSEQTQIVSRFGSTPCKALYKCLQCLEPFDAFKQH